MSTETMQLPNKTVERIYKALVVLSRRTLPSINDDTRVGRLRRHFAPLAEPIEEARQRKMIEHSKLVGDESQITNAAAIAQSNLDIAGELCTFERPHWVVTEAMMPKTLKTGLGEENRAGVGELQVELDFLYQWPEDPDAPKGTE